MCGFSATALIRMTGRVAVCSIAAICSPSRLASIALAAGDPLSTSTHTAVSPASNRFAFGPVETVTTARSGDVEFDYRIGRFATQVPRALNVVTRCRGLEARMRLTGQGVARAHLDLASTTLYEFESLRAWLAASPLQLRFAARNDETGVFLLEKPA